MFPKPATLAQSACCENLSRFCHVSSNGDVETGLKMLVSAHCSAGTLEPELRSARSNTVNEVTHRSRRTAIECCSFMMRIGWGNRRVRKRARLKYVRKIKVRVRTLRQLLKDFLPTGRPKGVAAVRRICQAYICGEGLEKGKKRRKKYTLFFSPPHDSH